MSNGRLLELTPQAPVPSTPEVKAARAAHTAALRAHRRAESQLADSFDAVADAEGAVRTAQAKVEDYTADEKKTPWQRVAAGEDVAKAERALARRREALQAAHHDLDDAADAVLAAEHDLSNVMVAAEQQAAAELAAQPAERKAVYANVDEWVNGFLLTHHRRPFSGTTWCPNWWEHVEATARLEACWRAWEHLRHEGPTGPAVWFRDYFDPMMTVLTSKDGPFYKCGPNAELHPHQVPDMWPVVAPPAKLFRAANHPDEQ